MRYCILICLGIILLAAGCRRTPKAPPQTCYLLADSAYLQRDSALPQQVVAFAQTLIGKPYKFGCAAPGTGFDCSGFINYVFDHFNIDVPRSSIAFTNEGTTIPLANALPGDLILFTGTNSKVRKVGHIGMVIAHDSSGLDFIHASSGSDYSVVITPLNDYYMSRFVKVIRIAR